MDWNGDGAKDLLVGEYNGQIRYYQNVGTAANPSLHYAGLLQAGGVTLDVGSYSTVWTDDWNEDGLVDVIAGCSDGYIKYYRNTGTAANPVLAAAQNLTYASGSVIDVGSRTAPVVADFNLDGVKDLVSGEMYGQLYYYQNNGTNANPLLANSAYLYTGPVQISIGSTSRPTAADWDGDGDMDLVVGGYDARLKRFMRVPSVTARNLNCDVVSTGGTTIPSGGGTLYYRFTGTNYTSQPVTFDAWTDLKLPSNTGYFGPLVVRHNVPLSASGALSRNVTQNIPGSFANGYYYLYGYLGDYSERQVYAQDYFTFNKSATDGGGPAVHDWACYGWPEEPAAPPDPVPLPEVPRLSAAPNPFNPATALSYQLASPGRVSLRIYDTAGREVRTLADGWREAGLHEVTFDGAGLAAGIYFAQLRTSGGNAATKLVFMR